MLERILVPLAEWSRTWADLERTMMPPGTAELSAQANGRH